MTDMLDEAIGAVRFANGQTGNVHFVATIMKAVARGELIRATPGAIAASPEGSALLAEALLAQREQFDAELAQARADAKAAVAVAITDAAGKLQDWEVRLSAVGKRDAAYYVDLSAALVRAIASEDAIAEVANLRAERDEWRAVSETLSEMSGNAEAERDRLAAELAAANAREAGLRQAVTKYQLALDSRENGNTAGYRFQDEVQRILDMPWRQGAALAQPSTEGGE